MLGEIAVASVVAFGVVAGRELERWVERRRLSGPPEPAPAQPRDGDWAAGPCLRASR